MQIDDVMALVDEYVSASIEDHGYRSGATSAEYLEDTKRKLLAAIAALIAAPAAPQQAEPVGYFVNDESDDQWHQVDYEQRNGADTYPLYLHPPADEVQQAEPAGEVARIGCHYAMLPDHVCNKCGRIHGYSHPHAAYLRGVDEGKRQAAAPQQVEPVAQIGWADEFGNLFPMGAWKPTQRTHHDSHKAAWRPVFLHPPADEVRLQGGLDNEELLEAWRTKVPGVEPTDSDLRAFALGVEFGTRGKRVYFDERNSARDAWRRRVKQCETLEAEVQRLRDALEQIEREANQPYIQRIAAAALKVGE